MTPQRARAGRHQATRSSKSYLTLIRILRPPAYSCKYPRTRFLGGGA